MLCAVLLALFAANASPNAFAGDEHVLRFSEGLDVTTLDPLLATVASVTDLGQLTMAHFVRFDSANRMVPELIIAIPTLANGGVSGDGKTITYHLRRGVRWSDGAPFDASDVVFTVETILNPKNNISERDSWDHLTGADAPDPYTVRFHLRGPYGGFASRFFASDTPSCVLPKHLLGTLATINQTPYNALPVGIGPFRYTAFRRGDAVEMEANPYYFRGRPKLQKIVYKLITEENTLLAQLQTGELDLWGTVGGTFYERVRALSAIDVTIKPSNFMAGVYFNTVRPALGDPNVRRALLLATDRAFILDKINHGAGVLTESVVPQVSQDYAALPLTRYDPAAAARLLDASGWKVGPDGVRAKGSTRLAIQIALPIGYVPSQLTAEILRATWQKLGIAVETKAYADAQYFAPFSEGGLLQSGNFDGAILSEQGNYDADVTSRFGCAYVPPHGFNFDRFCDPRLDESAQAYGRSFDPRERARLAADFQRTLERETPALILYERGFIYAFSHRITGFHPGSFTAFDDFMNVDVTPSPH